MEHDPTDLLHKIKDKDEIFFLPFISILKYPQQTAYLILSNGQGPCHRYLSASVSVLNEIKLPVIIRTISRVNLLSKPAHAYLIHTANIVGRCNTCSLSTREKATANSKYSYINLFVQHEHTVATEFIPSLFCLFAAASAAQFAAVCRVSLVVGAQLAFKRSEKGRR